MPDLLTDVERTRNWTTSSALVCVWRQCISVYQRLALCLQSSTSAGLTIAGHQGLTGLFLFLFFLINKYLTFKYLTYTEFPGTDSQR